MQKKWIALNEAEWMLILHALNKLRKYGREWVVGNTTWLTTIYKKPEPSPRTGY